MCTKRKISSHRNYFWLFEKLKDLGWNRFRFVNCINRTITYLVMILFFVGMFFFPFFLTVYIHGIIIINILEFMFKDRYDSRRTGQDYDGFPNCEYRNDRTIK
jgi:phosphoglycerol transferase MdoB-like AlkP superfamily enzyme